MPRVKTDGTMLMHRRLTMKLLLRLVSAAAMLGAVLGAAPATNTMSVVAERLSAADANVFFGYYDLPPVDAPTGRQLAHRVPFRDRLPVAGDQVIVHGGTYREWVKPPRGGTSEERRITYRAAAGEQVFVKGSERVVDWQPQGGGVWLAELLCAGRQPERRKRWV